MFGKPRSDIVDASEIRLRRLGRGDQVDFADQIGHIPWKQKDRHHGRYMSEPNNSSGKFLVILS